MIKQLLCCAASAITIAAALVGCSSETDSSPSGAGASTGTHAGGSAGQGDCVPEVLAAGIVSPSLVAVNDTGVYWADQQALRLQLHGSDAPVTLTEAADEPSDLTVDESYLYWTDLAGVHRVDIQTNVEQLLLPAPSGSCPRALAADSSAVYWGDECAEEIGRVNKDGTASVTLATDVVGVSSIAVDSTALYATAESQGTIVRILLADGSVSEFATGQNGPQSVTTDPSNVYWSSGVDVMQAPKATGIPRVIATEVQQDLYYHITSIAAEEAGVYWLYADAVRGQIPAGGATVTLATGQAHPQHVVLHSSGIYWANNNAGSIMRCPR